MGQGTTESVYHKVRPGSGDKNNQPAVIPGGQNTPPHERFASAPQSEEHFYDTSESRAESLLLDKESPESDDPPKERPKQSSSPCLCKEALVEMTTTRQPLL